MQLNGLERIALIYSDLLPAEGNLMLMRPTREVRKQVNFSDPELTVIDYKLLDSGGFTYSRAKAENMVIEVEFPKHVVDHIWAKLTALEKDSKLTEALLPVYEKFERLMQEPGFA